MFEFIKEIMSKGEIEKALLDLLSLVKIKYPDYQNDLILLSGRFNKWKREKILGIDDSNEKEWSRINYSILQIISQIEFENQIDEIKKSDLTGYLLVRYWSNKKNKDDYTINDEENENIRNIHELSKGRKYIIKYAVGANLRAYLPPKKGYSNQSIKNTKLIGNLKQCTKVEITEPIFQFSENDYWAKIKVIN